MISKSSLTKLDKEEKKVKVLEKPFKNIKNLSKIILNMLEKILRMKLDQFIIKIKKWIKDLWLSIKRTN